MFITPRPRTPSVSSKWTTISRLRAFSKDSCPYSLLGIDKGATRSEIRAAYVQRMKYIHPDVNQIDTTASAAAVNQAYETLCSQSLPPSEDGIFKDVFDQPGNAEYLFVNPFQCRSVDPLQWRALQSIAKSEVIPEEALFKHRVSFSASAIVYLTSDQLDAIEREMDQMTWTLDFEFYSWIVDDALLRARMTNGVSSR